MHTASLYKPTLILSNSILYRLLCILYIIPCLSYAQHNNKIRIKEAYIKHFGLEEGLPSNEVYDSYQDKDGYMWFTTDRGIIRYDGTQLNIFDQNDGLSSSVNFYFYEDPIKGFWVNDLGGKLSYWNGENFKVFTHKSPIDIQHSDKIMSMIVNITDTSLALIEGNRRSYIVNYNEVIEINKQNGKTSISKFNAHQHKRFQSNNPETNFYLLLKQGINLNSQLPPCKLINFNTFAFIDSDSNVWQPHTNGAFFWEKGKYNTVPTVFFKGEHITSITKEKDGGYWFTSLTNGVHYMPSVHVKVYDYHIPNLESYIYGLAHSKNYLYISSYLGNLNIIDTALNINIFPCKNGQQPKYSPRSQEVHMRYYKYVETKQVYTKKDVHPNTNSSLVLENCTLDLRLNSIHLKSLNPSKAEYKDHIQLHRIICVKADKHANVFIGTRKNLVQTQVINDTAFQSPKELLPYRVNDIQFTTDHTSAFIATMNQGLYYTKNNGVEFIEHSILDHISYQSIYPENDSILWIGSNVGLYKAYLSFDKGYKIDKLVKFTIQDGLLSNNIKQIVGWNSSIWLATDKGICSFKPEKLKQNLGIPKIHLTQVKLNNDTITETESTLVLNPSENDLQIRYQGIEFDKPLYEKLFYRYKLKRENNTKQSLWIYTNSNITNFSNLSSGNYTFSVQCRSENDVWSHSAQFKFIIEEPYYRTPIFFILIFLFVLISGALTTLIIQRYKNKRLKEKIELREAQLSVLTNQMNPHFIFNTLNSIQSYIVTNNSEKASEYLSRLAKLMRKGLMFSKEQYIPIEEEITFIENYITLQNNRLNHKIEYNIHTTGVKYLKNIQIPSLITQPIVENAIIHAFNSSHPSPSLTINYHIHQQEKIVNVILEDNGVGIQTKSKPSHQSDGMRIVKERLDLLSKQTIIENFEYVFNTEHILSDPKYPGTKISLWMPLKTISN